MASNMKMGQNLDPREHENGLKFGPLNMKMGQNCDPLTWKWVKILTLNMKMG